MRILTRHVVSEVLKYFASSLIGLTLMLTLGMGVREGLARGLPPGLMFAIMPYMLPEILGITVPVAMLLAVSIVFGRMAAGQEVTALKAAGISPMVLVWPVVIVAFVLSLGGVWLHDTAATLGRPGVQRVAIESIEEIAYGMLQTERSFKCPQFSIAVKEVVDRKLIRPTILIHPRPGSPAVTLSAEEAELRADKAAGTLTIICRNVEVEVEGERPYRGILPYFEQVVPFPKLTRPVHRDWLGMAEIPKYLELLEADRQKLQDRLDTRPDADPADRARWTEQLRHVRHNIDRLRTEPYRRWSNGFAALCFVLIGMPASLWIRSGNFVTAFFVCFVPILVVYYPLLMIGEDLTTSGTLPPIAFWMGNAVISAPGVLLLYLYCRY